MKNIAIFGSGKGSNAENIINYFTLHKSVSIKLIITNNKYAGIINVAKKKKINFLVLNKIKPFIDENILKKLTIHQINFIVLAGFLLKIPEIIITNFPNAIINIHPALLPNFGGKGMYGLNVHRSVLENKEKFSGITIHFINNEYDKGKIIFQAKCAVLKNDTPKLLAKRIQKLEHQFYPIIIEKILQNDN
tara:strand:+ start:50 stop:622 length:573 start_codon:yes stop_codon:yes gene_type:complete